ncbi:MAG: hypothetical protein OEW15_17930 [Nitrospirota bacterium]|nr:hypothetical protein [Nitrospirota bacterium]
MRTHSLSLKIVTGVTLAFFCWSFLPLYSAVAFAVEKPSRGQGDAGTRGGKERTADTRIPTTGEKFEKALEAIRENVNKADEKLALSEIEGESKGQDIFAEIAEVKKQRTEIEKLDGELKAEFAATEKKLKNAGLPKEILDRHYKFVKYYEENLKELKVNLSAVEQSAVSGKQKKETIAKAKAHLEKTKAPSRHQKLDPNNLPFRNRREAKTIAPRLKKEQFEKDFPSKKNQGTRTAFSTQRLQRTAENLTTDGYLAQNTLSAQRTASLLDADQSPRLSHSRTSLWTRILDSSLHRYVSRLTSPVSRVQLAYNDIASDAPLQLPLPSGDNVGTVPEWLNRGMRGDFDVSFPVFAFSPNSELETLNLAAASAVDLPTVDDLAQTPEVQFTPDIISKAQELGGNPVKIYEWVRNNIEYAPTYGSIQGADQCLQSKICNDMDTASLLIALLRTSGIAAKYQYATVEIPIEQAMNWVGGVTDPKMVGTIFATNGVPVTLMKNSSSDYKAVQLEHVFVQAFIDYIPSRGAVHRQGDTWISLDPSFKQYNYTQGIDIKSAVPFDAQTFADQLVATATTNTVEGYVTNVNSALVQQTMQDYQTQVQNYIQQNHPNATVGDVIGKKEIIKQEFGILVGTLPYKTIQAGTEFANVPANLRATMSFSIPDATGIGTGLFYSTSLPEIAGKKITLSFSPATANDQAVIEALLPTLHADGTPIRPDELPASFPAYIINFRPELRIDGDVVQIGAASVMGKELSFNISLSEPGLDMSNIENIVKTGEYFGIAADAGRIGEKNISALKSRLESTKANLEGKNYDNMARDVLVGDLLFSTIQSYFAALDASDEVVSKKIGVIRYRALSVGMFSVTLYTQNLFGQPMLASANGLMMDVDHLMQIVFGKDSSMDRVKQYMLTSGSMSSALEHIVPENMLSTMNSQVQGVSTIKALSIANSEGIPIYTVDKSNIESITPKLRVDSEVVSDIVNAVNAGKLVIVSKENIAVGGWSGCGYAIIDPDTGAGAYMISGGQNGAIILLILTLAIVAIGACMVGGIGVVGAGIVVGSLAAELLGAFIMAVAPIFMAAMFWLAYQASPTFINNFSVIFTGLGVIIPFLFVAPIFAIIIDIYLGLSSWWSGWEFSLINIRRQDELFA